MSVVVVVVIEVVVAIVFYNVVKNIRNLKKCLTKSFVLDSLKYKALFTKIRLYLHLREVMQNLSGGIGP